MAEIKVDPQEFGELKGQMNEVHHMLTEITNGGCKIGVANKINIRWVWSALCLLSFGCGYGFIFLFQSVNALRVISGALAKGLQ